MSCYISGPIDFDFGCSRDIDSSERGEEHGVQPGLPSTSVSASLVPNNDGRPRVILWT